jgi:hypothetical protein
VDLLFVGAAQRPGLLRPVHIYPVGPHRRHQGLGGVFIDDVETLFAAFQADLQKRYRNLQLLFLGFVDRTNVLMQTRLLQGSAELIMRGVRHGHFYLGRGLEYQSTPHSRCSPAHRKSSVLAG